MKEALIEKLKKADLLKGKFDDYQKMYKMYIKERANGNQPMQAYTNVSMEIGYSEKTVQRAVNCFNEL